MMYQVKTFVLDKEYKENCFFILNKGYNAGKTSKNDFFKKRFIYNFNQRHFLSAFF